MLGLADGGSPALGHGYWGTITPLKITTHIQLAAARAVRFDIVPAMSGSSLRACPTTSPTISPRASGSSKKRGLGTRSAPKSRSRCRELSKVKVANKASMPTVVTDIIMEYIREPTLEKFRNTTIIPSVCCPYASYIVSRLTLEVSFAESPLSHPSDYFVRISQIENTELLSSEFEQFLAIVDSPFHDMHVITLLQLVAFISFAPEVVISILSEKGMLSNLLESVLNVLTEKRSSVKLAPAIAILAHIVEQEDNSRDKILSETNLSQLLKLCLTRALYPTLHEEEDNLHNELEICSCRIALRRLLLIPSVQASSSAQDEIQSFIQKWWQRLHISSMTPGVSGSFELPDASPPGKVPILRTALELLHDFVTARFTKHIFSALLLDEKSCGLEFMSSYIQCTDCKTSLAAMRLVKELDYSQTTSSVVSEYLASSDLHDKVHMSFFHHEFISCCTEC